MAAGAAAVLCAFRAAGLGWAGRANFALRIHRSIPGGDGWPRAWDCGAALKKCNVIKMYLSPRLAEAEAVTHTTLL